MTRKVFRALTGSVVEKLFIGKDEPAPEGWHETQKAALAAREMTHALEEPRAAEDDAQSSERAEVREEDGDPTERGSGVRTRRPEEGEEALNVHDFGAVGDGIADDTASIQAAVKAVPRRGPDRHRRGR